MEVPIQQEDNERHQSDAYTKAQANALYRINVFSVEEDIGPDEAWNKEN
jgi:hypothetical protein